MLGLPTETDEDVAAIAELVNKIVYCWRQSATNKKRRLSINLATAFFVPKPFTPFQWERQTSPEEYLRRVHLLQSCLTARGVDYRYHESDLSRLEAVLARGDRRLSKVLLRAHELGCKLDGWDEYFRYGPFPTAGSTRNFTRRAALRRTKSFRGRRSILA